MGLEHITEKNLFELGNDPSVVCFVILTDRPGAILFGVKLEYENFAINTPANDDFQLGLVPWPKDSGMVWEVIVIPADKKPIAEAVAKHCGLVIKDAFPVVLDGSGKPKKFPLTGENVFTLESAPDSDLYTNDPKKIAAMRLVEHVECNAIFVKYGSPPIHEHDLGV